MLKLQTTLYHFGNSSHWSTWWQSWNGCCVNFEIVLYMLFNYGCLNIVSGFLKWFLRSAVNISWLYFKMSCGFEEKALFEQGISHIYLSITLYIPKIKLIGNQPTAYPLKKILIKTQLKFPSVHSLGVVSCRIVDYPSEIPFWNCLFPANILNATTTTTRTTTNNNKSQ